MGYPKTFTKGDSTRVAHTAADQVAAEFDGFREAKTADVENLSDEGVADDVDAFDFDPASEGNTF